MVVRTSESLYLEVLEPAVASGVPIEVDVFDGASPATMLATLDGAHLKRFTRELSELGAGSFNIPVNDPKATANILAVGNLIKFRIGGIHRHAIWIEEPSTKVVAEDEGAGEEIAMSGRGALAYLERAACYPPIWPTAAVTFGSSSEGDNGAGAKSITATRPASTKAGDTLLAFIAISASGYGTAPSGWKLVGKENTPSTSLAVYRKTATSADAKAGKTWKWTFATTQTAT